MVRCVFKRTEWRGAADKTVGSEEATAENLMIMMTWTQWGWTEGIWIQAHIWPIEKMFITKCDKDYMGFQPELKTHNVFIHPCFPMVRGLQNPSAS